MKLKDYIKELQTIAKEHPNLTVITASGDENSSFSKVTSLGALGHFYADCNEFNCDEDKINAVCVN